MSDVFFKLKTNLALEVRDAVLKRIEGLPGVNLVAPIKKTASKDSLRALCFARVADGVDIKRVVDMLEAMPEVQSASMPSRRGMA